MLQPCFNSPVCHRFSHVRRSEVKEPPVDISARVGPDHNIKLDGLGKLQEISIPGEPSQNREENFTPKLTQPRIRRKYIRYQYRRSSYFSRFWSSGAPVPTEPMNSFRPSGSVTSRPLAV